MASDWMVNADRWQAVDKLPPEAAARAARGSVAFLEEVRDLAASRAKAPQGEPLHRVWDFSAMDAATLDFLLATLGEGEVRIKLCGGEAKVGDTGVPGLWRVENGREGHAGSFVLARLPRCVEVMAREGLDAVPEVVNRGPDVFAAPAILEELRHQLADADLETLPEKPAFSVELTRQPLSPGDRTALYSTLGRGKVEVELRGFADSRITQTAVRGVWHSTILNNVGKTLMESYVVAGIPPEVPIAEEEFQDAAAKCQELIDWVAQDIERGVFGGSHA